MRGCVVLALLLLLPSAVFAAELDPPHPGLGETATLTLETAPADSTEMPTSVGALLRATTDPRRFEVIPVRVGEVRVALGDADTLRFEVVGAIESADPASLRPIDSVGDLGPDWLPTAALLAALALPLVVLLVWWLRRRGARAPVFELPAEPPHEVALRRLAEIEGQGLPGRGEFDRFYVEASHALRGYVGGRFLVPALDWTREETVRRLIEAGHDREILDEVDPLLRAADEVKFARHAPTVHQADEWMRRARTWIEETAVEVVYTTPDAVAAAHAFNGHRGR